MLDNPGLHKKTERKEGLRITNKDLSELLDQQHRHYAKTVKPGSALDKFDDTLNQLSRSERKILNLSHVENKSFDEISKQVSLPHHNGQQVQNTYDESMSKLIEELGLSEGGIRHLFRFKDLHYRTLMLANVLCK